MDRINCMAMKNNLEINHISFGSGFIMITEEEEEEKAKFQKKLCGNR